ncbi:MAG: hypothetical protein JW893_03995 [Candidatus Omnitrophica bacterium]|nr:hypothetical protein [Candidatus Omnitrophota bacterium]
MKNWQIVMEGNFKWDFGPPIWSSVFLGSNDQIFCYEEIIRQLRGFCREEMELVSVIGGMRFLSFLEDLEFSRITLFDQNINELTKIIRVEEYLSRTPFEKFDHFHELNQSIYENPSAFYFPEDLCRRGVQFKVSDDSFRFHYEKKRVPLYTVLSPSQYPHYRWDPHPEAYEKARRNLSEVTNRELYTQIPSINAQGRVVVAYLSHCKINCEMLVARIQNAAFIIPIYSIHAKEAGSNEEALNPHRYWQHRVDQFKQGRTLQIWAPEDKKLVGSRFDQPFELGVEAKVFMKKNFRQCFDTIVLHIFFGKCQRGPRKKREKLFCDVVSKAGELAQRVMVTEHYQESGQFGECKHLPQKSEIVEMTGQSLGNKFNLQHIGFSAGRGAPDRNLHIIFDKKL